MSMITNQRGGYPAIPDYYPSHKPQEIILFTNYISGKNFVPMKMEKYSTWLLVFAFDIYQKFLQEMYTFILKRFLIINYYILLSLV